MMKFERNLLRFEKDDVIYNDIYLGITRQNIFDYVIQTGLPSEDLILHRYRSSLRELRDEQLNKILDDREGQDKVD